jgi:hypothetical protein
MTKLLNPQNFYVTSFISEKYRPLLNCRLNLLACKEVIIVMKKKI